MRGKMKNIGSFSLELIAIVVCVILVALLSLTSFGTQISNTIHDSTNTVDSLTGNVLSRYDNGSGGPDGNNPGAIDMSNINSNGVIGNFSTKGNLVTINGEQYRVLAVSGTQAKVMSMGESMSTAYNETSLTANFNGTTGQKYQGSTLDQAMATYYNALPSAIQNAIIEQNINQSMYTWSDGTNTSADYSSWFNYPLNESDTSGTNYYLVRNSEISVGARKVFAPDLDDVIAYLGANASPHAVNQLFFGVSGSVNPGVWLRSAQGNTADYASFAWGYGGDLSGSYYSGSNQGRPTFVLDLSLLG